MATKKKKVERNLVYANEQVERFLKYQYQVTFPITVYGHKKIEKQGLYSRVDFKRGKPVAIDLSYNLLASNKREDILKATLREAIKVALWFHRQPYTETSKEYIRELDKYGLPKYGGLSQTGKELHTYRCSQCEKIYALRERKLSKTQDLSEQNVLTPCCKERFEYAGVIHYTNLQLRSLHQQQQE